jgi:hypothetical protein
MMVGHDIYLWNSDFVLVTITFSIVHGKNTEKLVTAMLKENLRQQIELAFPACM